MRIANSSRIAAGDRLAVAIHLESSEWFTGVFLAVESVRRLRAEVEWGTDVTAIPHLGPSVRCSAA
jgi:hypothetical protein